MDSSRSSDPRIGFSPRPERALGWWEPATLHPAHVRPREEPIAKLGHGQEAGVGAEPLDGGKARIAAKEAKVQTGPGFHPPKKRRSLGKGPKSPVLHFHITSLMSLENVTSRQTLLTLLPLFPTFAWTHDSVWPRRELVRMQCKAWG